VFSSLGFYPENSASGIYVLGSPLFDKAAIKTGNKTFTVQTEGNSAENIYIQSVTLNGKPYSKSFITHQDIVNGGTMVITMGSKPNYDFGKAREDRPSNGL
jgi:putative alpha-1,2-mannosidase